MELKRMIIALSLLRYTTHGADISSHCLLDEICLTSFKQCDNNEEQACREPPGSYPWMTPGGSAQLPALLDGNDYTISWIFGPQGQADIPVRIQWQMDRVVWEINTTETKYIFNPGKILGSFPTPQAPNMTTESAWFNASRYSGNMLILSQPVGRGASDSIPMAVSQQFTVQSRVVEDYIQTQIDISKQTEYNRWRLGVSIGLGIGVPFLLVTTATLVMALARMHAGQRFDDSVDVTAHEARIY